MQQEQTGRWWRILQPGVAVCLLLLGTALVHAGLTTARDDVAAWRARSLPATGTVVALEEQTAYSGSEGRERVTAFPVITFVTREGRTVTYRDPAPNTPVQAFLVGDTVPVRYDPADPSRAGLDTPLTAHAPPVIITVVGGVLALAGAWLLQGTWRRMRAAR
jgi:hypothetical protein